MANGIESEQEDGQWNSIKVFQVIMENPVADGQIIIKLFDDIASIQCSWAPCQPVYRYWMNCQRERDMVVRSRWRQTRQLGGKSRAFQSHRLALSNSGATIVEWCHGVVEAATRNVRGGWQLNISESGKYICQLVWTGCKMRWSLRITQRYHISCCSWGHSDFMCRPSGSFQQLLLSVVVLHTEL